jgi:acylphosphatase
VKVCVRCLVSGLVQGVFYRASARQKARELGVTGWARNLPDGRVEVLACGEQAAVEALCAWLRQGPSAAKVTDLACNAVEYRELPDFHTR